MMTRKLWMSLLVASVVALSGCDDGGGVPDGGLVQPDGARLCTGGETRCDGMCVDVERDRDHCGACGTVCGTAEACVAGACTLVCPAEQVVCEGSCVVLDDDESNCGACGTACAQGETCVSGSCEVVCPAGQTECDGACVSTGSDPSHCGACGTTCAAGEVCDMGACALSCSFGLTECDGACVDLDNSPANCGACGFTCDAPDGAIGLCAARRCRTACDGAFLDCNADLADASGDGCEIDGDIDPNNCGACGIVCEADNATTGCATGTCTIAMCDAGFADCDSDFSNGCELDGRFDDMNCGACGNVCPATESCVLGMCSGPLGEDCSNAIALSVGSNTVGWNATTNDYLTSSPSCASSFSPDGPDVVMSYTATADEIIEITFGGKPTSTRWAASVSSVCGTVTPELSCGSEFSGSTIDMDPFTLRTGETGYIYIVDTTSGSNPLGNPLDVQVTTTPCTGTPTPMVTDRSPAPASTTGTLAPEISATFDNPISRITGTISLSGDMGTSASYDLSTSPPEVSFNSAGTVVTVAAQAYAPGETITVTMTGLESELCFRSIPTVTWSFSVPTPSCAPGVGGSVGTTTGRVPSGLSFLTEYYVHPDDIPGGWVYFGGTSDFYRIPKAGGATEDIEALASLTFTNLGYEAVVVGAEVYTIDSTTSSTGRIYRVTTNGGLTWMAEDYATFPTNPADDFRGATAIPSTGRIFMVTHEFTTSVDTEIWSVPIGGVAPVVATLEASVSGGLQYCSGIARDAANFYLACGGGDELVRVPLAGGMPTVITTAIPLNTTKNEVQGQDLGGDGIFDILYVNGGEGVYFVCDPAGATSFASPMVTPSSGTGNYGLGYDRTANVLWSYDDDTEDLVSIQ